MKGKLKKIVKRTFRSFFYFYDYLGYRIFITFALSMFTGVLDGLGLTMFIPLLKMLDSEESGDGNFGKLQFIPNALEYFGVPFNIMSVLTIILIFFILKGFFTFLNGYVSVIFQQLFMEKIRITNIDLMNSYAFSQIVKAD